MSNDTSQQQVYAIAPPAGMTLITSNGREIPFAITRLGGE